MYYLKCSCGFKMLVCRNSRGCGELFVHESHGVSSMLYGLYEDFPDASSDQASKLINQSPDIIIFKCYCFLQSVPLNPSLTNGMSGIIKLDDKMQQHLNSGWVFCFHLYGFPMLDGVRFIEPPFLPLRPIKDNRAVSCQYEDPYFPTAFVFEATLLPGAEYVFCICDIVILSYCNILKDSTTYFETRELWSRCIFSCARI